MAPILKVEMMTVVSHVVYRFRGFGDRPGLGEAFEQRFTTIKLAMRKAYLDWLYKRFKPEKIRTAEAEFDLSAMQAYWKKEGWEAP
ncbi:hypothetical protein ABG088_10565 [Hydrogenibacillus schlegelii]|uniref:Uncharacterized protein n=3 Tax=Hydrogenibacillus schlegelii TaxID=1484 RepID=A0A179IQX0_HYDSH|nr:hypothetical protein [Hydrogenibacillus schlegelii]OAR03854.1 hypothetical protein SA87_03180 [Hydrogenibacillus schlegelii]